MGYLTLPDGIPDFSKAVISFWFRIPQASIDAAAAAFSFDNTDQPFNGIIPLVVMGKKGSSQDFDITRTSVVYYKIVNGETLTNPGTTTHTETGTTTITVTDNYHIGYTFGPVPDVLHYTGGSSGVQNVANTHPRGTAAPQDPVCIGIDCSSLAPGHGGAKKAVLYVHFETAKKPTVTNYQFDLRSIDPAVTSEPGGGGDYAPLTQTGTYSATYTGVFLAGAWFPIGPPLSVITDTRSFIQVPGMESYTPAVWHYVDVSEIVLNKTAVISSDTIPLDPTSSGADVWHHVLISLDLKDIKSHGLPTPDSSYSGNSADYIDSASRLFVALDDVNYTESSLSENWVDGSDDPNAVATQEALNVAGSEFTYDENLDSHPPGTPPPPVGGSPQYVASELTIPSNDQPMGLPGTPEFVDNIYRVEMAEFLMFTGVTLDTSVEKNRRLFITNKDKNGAQFPVNPSPTMIPISKTAVGDSATWEPGADTAAFAPPLSALDPSATGSGNKQLGMPVVDFTKCSFNWMMGRNVGSAKSKVVTTGKIKAYAPPVGSDPKLESGS